MKGSIAKEMKIKEGEPVTERGGKEETGGIIHRWGDLEALEWKRKPFFEKIISPSLCIGSRDQRRISPFTTSASPLVYFEGHISWHGSE